ncbi:MAG: S-methyl-5-thioribose-1-phosphate isomerase, partial [Thermoanaerobaculia bacterium]
IALAAAAVPENEVADRVSKGAELLRATRPTAVNLGWAIDRMLSALERFSHDGRALLGDRLAAEAVRMFEEDLEANRKIGEYGNRLLQEETTVLTHCNAGALATSGFGTALGVIRCAHRAGKKIHVYADETRPWLQGARLTAWELQQEGIDVTLIADDMAGYFFSRGSFDAVIVGADRIAANGDVANKIGTYTLAVLAHEHKVPFYVAAPLSTIDRRCETGDAIPIEERNPDEVTHVGGCDESGVFHRVSIAPAGVKARHPAFDVTPARLVSAIITERGVLKAPYEHSIGALFR